MRIYISYPELFARGILSLYIMYTVLTDRLREVSRIPNIE